MASRLIAIIGGIGSGKSVVSRILRVMGYPVYDTDSGARRLMNGDQALKKRLIARFGPEIYSQEGQLDARRLSSIVFNDHEALLALNGIVHPAVKQDVQSWARQCEARYAFAETALLYESGMNQIVDAIWKVTAPARVRVERVIARNGLPEAQVRARIEAQRIEDRDDAKAQVIVNDGCEAVLPQVVRLLK